MATIGEVVYNDLLIEKKETESIVLSVGAIYSAGQLITLQTSNKYKAATILNPEDSTTGTELPFSEQKIYVLTEDVDAILADKTTVGFTGSFNRNNVIFAAGQVEDDVAGTLQAKNIILKDWSVS